MLPRQHTEKMPMSKLFAHSLALGLAVVLPQNATAQTQPAAPAAATAPSQQSMTAEQLDQLTSPIALYPDPDTSVGHPLLTRQIEQLDRFSRSS